MSGNPIIERAIKKNIIERGARNRARIKSERIRDARKPDNAKPPPDIPPQQKDTASRDDDFVICSECDGSGELERREKGHRETTLGDCPYCSSGYQGEQ